VTICHDERPCFARTSKKVCRLLNQDYSMEKKPCPFCKEHIDDVIPTEVLFPKKKLAIEKEPS
jgi:hypothetical protein